MKDCRAIGIFLILVSAHFLLGGCAMHRKITRLEEDSMSAGLALSRQESFIPEQRKLELESDTLIIHDDEGKEMIIMKAIRDDETGEMVANDVISAAVVTARFRNIAERHGKVDLQFQIIVPESMQDSKWQLRFFPDLFIQEDSIRLDSVIVTGNAYRKSQLRGSQQYQKFLKKIMSDSTMFNNIWQFELFLKRNIPEIYKFKNDTSYVSDETFASCFGVDEQEAMAHYNHRDNKRNRMYQKFTKKAIVTEGVRLDTVMRSVEGDFIYNYTQTINTRPQLRKADIILSGTIYEQGEKVYEMPTSDPLTFYISSISAFTDNTIHYKTRVIERSAEANTACRIDFEVGKSDVNLALENNLSEISRIKTNLRSLLNDEVFDLDSITVDATASPEGSYQANATLAQRRSESVSGYFKNFISYYKDSLKREEGIVVNMDDTFIPAEKRIPDIKFISHSTPENWTELLSLVEGDSLLTERQKDSFSKLYRKFSNLDKREQEMKQGDYYPYIRSNLYPKLRTVRFNFYLHRRGMVKDTVHTTVIDTAYMQGVQALKDMDYETALEYLRPYNDFNTAVVYTALDRNLNAMEIVSRLPRTAEVNYLLAILYSRMNDQQQAVECYVRSCQQNQSYVYRGNLDPEISALIKKYGLNQEDEDDLLL